MPQIQNQVVYLETHLTLLRHAREIGILAAWDEFKAEHIASREDQGSEAGVGLTQEEADRGAEDAAFLAEKLGLAADAPQIPALQERLRQMLAQAQQPLTPDPKAVADALVAFLNTNSWDETRAILEREQALLLTAVADQVVAARIAQAVQEQDQRRADYLTAHRTLLRQARAMGVPAAWEEFEAARQTAEEMPPPDMADQPAEDWVALTPEEAECASQDAAFLAEQLGLAPDDPTIPTLQAHLRQTLAGDKGEEGTGKHGPDARQP